MSIVISSQLDKLVKTHFDSNEHGKSTTAHKYATSKRHTYKNYLTNNKFYGIINYIVEVEQLDM